ncbi:early activation antigen CD69 isoform X2 [Halichoeres trimaculatus]|uniref:early activation antigen CD69 isoform X2 n=1 Tax=Halichoeres trimaculatus TaxID=147232 RepID=UPI003D9F0EB5
MYIKFFHGYGQDKTHEAADNSSSESELSVELQEKKDSQKKGKARLYRLACVILTVICLVLLLVVIILSVKLQTGSPACTEGEETFALSKQGALSCSFDQCQALFPKVELKYLGCRQCADGWLTFGRSCFYLSTFRRSWDESQRDCSSRGGSLAVISSPDIQSYLTMKGNVKYWIGLRHNGLTWRWVNNTELGQSYWADFTSDGDCGFLNSGGPPEKNWMKASCQASAYFICQLWTQEH